jgi:hypothetical protein
MDMQRRIGAALAAGMAAIIGPGRATAPAPIHRVASGSKRARQMVSNSAHSRSKYVPHQGEKERERAARCYMSSTFGVNGNPRCAPVMHQLSKSEFYGYRSAF